MTSNVLQGNFRQPPKELALTIGVKCDEIYHNDEVIVLRLQVQVGGEPAAPSYHVIPLNDLG